MANNYTTVSKKGIEYLCGLINQLANVSEGIDDLNLRTDGTFSSVKIDTLLNTLKTDCNDYTDRLVANLSRLELKIATSESEITQPNTMYLYKPSGSSSYEQYVVIEGTKVLLGTTDINMGDYYTITQTDAKFVLKTDFDSLKTEVDKKVNKTDIVDNLTSTDTDKPLSANQGKVLKDEVDLKANDSDVVKRTDIVTTIDRSSTNDKIPSASAIYNKSKNRISQVRTDGDILAYADSIIGEEVSDTVRIMNGKNSPYGADDKDNDFHYVIYNIADVRFRRVVAYDIRKNDMYMIMKNGGKWGTWRKVCTTSVNDSSGKVTLPDGVTGTITYKVINGVCYAYGQKLAEGLTGSSVVKISGLPKQATVVNVSLENSGNRVGTIYSYDALTFGIHKSSTTAGFGSFSYQVAES